MICLREEGKDRKREVLNGVDIRRVPIKRRRGGVFGYIHQYSAFLLISSAIFAVRSLTRRYDLVYVHNMPDVLVLGGLVPKAFGAKMILDLHDPAPGSLKVESADRSTLDAAAVTLISPEPPHLSQVTSPDSTRAENPSPRIDLPHPEQRS